MTKVEANVIIGVLDSKFDSHDFLCEFINRFPRSYGELLVKHNNVNSAHAEIANFLRLNSSFFKIQKIGESKSSDIFGHIVPCVNWQKVQNS